MPVPIQPSTPEADDLSFRVSELNDSVQGLRDSQEENTRVLLEKQTKSDRALRATRRLWIGFTVVLVVGLVWNFAQNARLQHVIDRQHAEAEQREEDTTRADVVNCLNANASRAAREARDEQLGGIIYDTLGEVAPPATPEEAARRQGILDKATASYVQKLRDTLPVELQQRDCSEQAVTTPTLVGGSPAG